MSTVIIPREIQMLVLRWFGYKTTVQILDIEHDGATCNIIKVFTINNSGEKFFNRLATDKQFSKILDALTTRIMEEKI